MSERPTRLRQARLNAGFKSARSAANRYGWSISTYTAHENGQNDFSEATAAQYAKALKCNLAWLYLGYATEREKYVWLANLSGELRSKKVILYNGTEGPMAELGFMLHENSKLFEVSDNDLWPRYGEGDLIVTGSDNHDPPFDNTEYIFMRADGDPLIGNAHKTTRKGMYDIITYFSPPLRDVVITDAFEVLARYAPAIWQKRP